MSGDTNELLITVEIVDEDIARAYFPTRPQHALEAEHSNILGDLIHYGRRILGSDITGRPAAVSVHFPDGGVLPLNLPRTPQSHSSPGESRSDLATYDDRFMRFRDTYLRWHMPPVEITALCISTGNYTFVSIPQYDILLTFDVDESEIVEAVQATLSTYLRVEAEEIALTLQGPVEMLGANLLKRRLDTDLDGLLPYALGEKAYTTRQAFDLMSDMHSVAARTVNS